MHEGWAFRILSTVEDLSLETEVASQNISKPYSRASAFMFLTAGAYQDTA